MYLETCSRCGLCVKACHVHESMPRAKYIAAYRAEIVRRIYKKYFKGQGRFWPSAGESRELTDSALAELYDAAYSCTGCRRCMVLLPVRDRYAAHHVHCEAPADRRRVRNPKSSPCWRTCPSKRGRSVDLTRESYLQGIKTLETQVVERWKSEAGKNADPNGGARCGPPLRGPRGGPFHHPGGGRLQRSGGKLEPELLRSGEFRGLRRRSRPNEAHPGEDRERSEPARREGSLHLANAVPPSG